MRFQLRIEAHTVPRAVLLRGAQVQGGQTRILLPVLLTVPLLALLWLIATQSRPMASPNKSSAPPPRSLYRTTAAQLYRDYNTDPTGTQARIGQRRILVTGTVVDVSTDYLGQNLVLLDAGNGISTADMTLAPDQNLLALQLKRGQSVSITCDEMQRYSDSPTGSNCALVAPHVASESPPQGARPSPLPAAPTAAPVGSLPGMVSLNDRRARYVGP